LTGNVFATCRAWLAPHLMSIGRRPWFAGLTAAVGTFAGFLAAIYSDNVRVAFPFSPPHDLWWSGPLVVSALVTWVALITFGCMFGINSWALSSASDFQIQALQKSTQELHDVIRTQPPRNFLVSFQDFLVLAYPPIMAGLSDGQTEIKIREGIVAVLSNLAFMAQLFDRQQKRRRYCANVMLFRDFATLTETERSDLSGLAKFRERPPTDGVGWYGVLELRPDLAVSLKGDEGIAIDESLPRFVLEIPGERERIDAEGRGLVLPGAPEAFCARAYTYIPDAYLMGDSCSQERGLRPAISTDMDRYFKEGNGRDVRSFISIPILPSGCGNRRDGTPLGVLNIHCDQPYMLRSREGVELFVPMTAPHLLFVAHLIENSLKSAPKAPI
jgi:hypothetical protein